MIKIILALAVFTPILADHIDHDAQIVNYQSDIHPDGSYQYAYETTNGIAAQEQGAGGVGASGSAQYVAPDGQVIKLSYNADANGFVAEGSHIHPIPEAILRSLEWNRNHPEEDDYLRPELSGVRPHGGLPVVHPQVRPSAHY